MAVVRHYVMIAKPGEQQAVLAAFARLAEAVLAIPGCTGTELLQDAERAERFVFIERWADIASHKAGASALPKEAIAPLMALLDGRPEGSYLAVLA